MTAPANSVTRSPTRSPTYSPTAWKWDSGAVAAAGIARQFMAVSGYQNTNTTTTQQYMTPQGMVNEA